MTPPPARPYAHAPTTHALRKPFTISRGTSQTATLVHLRIRAGGDTGWGEAAPSASVSGERREDTLAALAHVRPATLDHRDPEASLAVQGDLPPAARAALDLALHDLAGRAAGTPVHKLLGLPAAARPTTCTVSLAPADEMLLEAQAWVKAGARRLKVKLGRGDGDVAALGALRKALPRVPLAVDANEGWSAGASPRLAAAVDALGVEFIEQPVPRGELAGLRATQEACSCPVVADEAVRSAADVERLAAAEACDGVNIKVQKVGGLLAALDCLDAAREYGLKVLVGCNLETGLGIAAGAALAGRATWLDLDGHLLLADDPFRAPWNVGDDVGTLDAPGLGVGPTNAFAAAFDGSLTTPDPPT